MNRLVAVIAACLVLAVARTALGAHPDVVVKLLQQNSSGEYGTATLSDLDGRTRVVIDLEHENTSGDQPAHIHLGSCAKLNPAPKYPLKSVILGHSNTVVDVPMKTLLGGTMAINVHESTKQLTKYVACGDIP
jgi:hypothetical protein